LKLLSEALASISVPSTVKCSSLISAGSGRRQTARNGFPLQVEKVAAALPLPGACRSAIAIFAPDIS
jgi:hypothetical protein